MLSDENIAYKRLLPCGILILIAMVTILYLLTNPQNAKLETFHSLGFHEPLIESQVINLTMESEYMDREMPYIIYLPKGYGKGVAYPVWYGLNSYSTDEAMWINNGIDIVADQLIENNEIQPMIMVFPYTKDATAKEIIKDLEDGKVEERNIDRFITKELIPYIDSHYYTSTSSDHRFIGGFSLGGMIALRIAFHHTDLFSKVGGYSPGVLWSDYSGKELETWLYPNIDIHNVETFDRKHGFHKLHIHLEAGNSNDPFSVGIQSLYEALLKRGIPSEFELYDGGHSLRRDRFEDYLRFYAEID